VPVWILSCSAEGLVGTPEWALLLHASLGARVLPGTDRQHDAVVDEPWHGNDGTGVRGDRSVLRSPLRLRC
jgi:hypothetical protein